MRRWLRMGPGAAVSVVFLLAASALALPAATGDGSLGRNSSVRAVEADQGGAGSPDFTKFSQVWSTASDGNVPVWGVANSPNGSFAAFGQATTFAGGEVHVLNAATGVEIKEYEVGADVYAVQFSPDGTRLAMGGLSQRIMVANTSGWSQDPRPQNINTNEPINDIAWSDDSRYVFAAVGQPGNDGAIVVLDSQANYVQVPSMSKFFSGRAAHSVDSHGKQYVAGLDEAPSAADAFIYSIPGGTTVRSTWVSADTMRVRYDPSGNYVAIGRGSNRVGTGGISNEVDAFVWDAAFNYSGSGTKPHVDFTLHANTLVTRVVAWSPDGAAIATGGLNANEQLRFWSPADGKELAHFPMNNLRAGQFAPDGLSVLLAQENRALMWGDRTPPTLTGMTVETPERAGLPLIGRYLQGERAVFVFSFDEDMDMNVTPTALFGDVAPYDAFSVTKGNWRGPRTWAGEFDLRNASVNETFHSISVEGAKDRAGNAMAAGPGFEFSVDRTAPTFARADPPYWQRNAPLLLPVNLSDPVPRNRSASGLWEVNGTREASIDGNLSWLGPYLTSPLALNGNLTFQGTLTLALPEGQGHYRFDLRLRDRAMNEVTGVRLTPGQVLIGLDNGPPVIQLFGTGSQWSKGPTIDLPYRVADNVGLARLDVSAAYSPDAANWTGIAGVNLNLTGIVSNGTIGYPSSQEGWYRFDAIATDESGLVSANASSQVGKDTTPPESSLAPLPPLTNDSKILLKYSASDVGSGIQSVEVEARSAGGQWSLAGSGTSVTGQVTFAAGADGVYEFRSLAGDRAGNREATPVGNDSWVRLDATPPRVTVQEPTPGATGIPVTATVRARFSEAVDLADITTSLTGPGGALAGTVSMAGLELTFTPAQPLAVNAQHFFTVGVRDLAGNGGGASWGFTTWRPLDGVPPKVVTTSPQSGEVVPALTLVSVEFDEQMSATTLESPVVTGAGGATVTNPRLSNDGIRLEFAIDPLVDGTSYVVTILAAAARDSSGEMLDGNKDGTSGDDYVFSFQLSSVPAGSILATVLDSNEKPMTGATVHLLAGGNRILTISSDVRGEARFAPLIPGEYGVEALAGNATSGVHEAKVKSGEETKLTLRIGGPAARSGLDNILVLLPFIAALSIGVALAAYFRRRSKCPSCRKPVPSRSLRCPACGFHLKPQAAEFFDPGAQVAIAVPGAQPPEVAGARGTQTSTSGWGASGVGGAGPVIPQRVAGGPQLTGKERIVAEAPPLRRGREVEVDETPDVEADEVEDVPEGADKKPPTSKFNPYKPVLLRVDEAGEVVKDEGAPEAGPTIVPAPAPAPVPVKPNQVEISELEEEVPPPPDDEPEASEKKEDPFAKTRRRRRDRLARGEG